MSRIFSPDWRRIWIDEKFLITCYSPMTDLINKKLFWPIDRITNYLLIFLYLEGYEHYILPLKSTHKIIDYLVLWAFFVTFWYEKLRFPDSSTNIYSGISPQNEHYLKANKDWQFLQIWYSYDGGALYKSFSSNLITLEMFPFSSLVMYFRDSFKKFI